MSKKIIIPILILVSLAVVGYLNSSTFVKYPPPWMEECDSSDSESDWNSAFKKKRR